VKRLATGAVLEVPAGALAAVAADPNVDQLSSNYAIRSQMAVTNQTIGADLTQEGGWAQGIGALTGEGIGVAVIDSGVSPVPELKDRIVVNVDFISRRGAALDQYGHGTHVAGIIAASGKNRVSDTTGVAPGAHIINLKVLDENGAGTVADAVEAVDWAIAHKDQYNIRVINMSLGGPVLQGWRDDPLAQAVERAYRAGMTVVAAAGNFGKADDGRLIYGSVSTPGISPYALTVGALNTKNTPWRSDDEVASYSSKGPTMYDQLVKPDLVAPGNKILGLAAPGSTLVQEYPELVTAGRGGRTLQLSGTSMSAAVVSGAVAVLLDRDTRLSPLSVRALLQYSSSPMDQGMLVSGAGSLNLIAALHMPIPGAAPAIAGEQSTPSRIVVASQPLFETADGQNVADIDNVLWGGADSLLWGSGLGDNILWGSGLGDNILWGSGLGDNILWGSTLVLGD
jgi:serine protease AprX